MPANSFTCPYCMFEAPLSLFENVGGGELKCRRCRSRFEDPNAFSADTAYADCDSLRPVTRFPFSLKGKRAVIRVRDGYLAFLPGPGGQNLWIDGPEYTAEDLPAGSRVYYVCLTPRVTWGAGGAQEFGAYGSAQLTLTKAFVRSFCGQEGRLQALEDHLKKAVSGRVADFIRLETARQNTGMLEQRDGYLSTLGQIEEGVRLTRIDPLGFRNSAGKTGTFLSFLEGAGPEEEEAAVPPYKPPAELLKTPRSAYTVKTGTEDVLIRGMSRGERHKAGDVITLDTLRGAGRLIRFRSKTFELPFGWGIFNQTCQWPGYYAAQGTISFYIDSTEQMSLLLNKTKNWQEFEEQFYTNIFRKELSAALRDILDERIGRPGRSDAVDPTVPVNDLIQCENHVSDRSGFADPGDPAVFKPVAQVLPPILAKEIRHLG